MDAPQPPFYKNDSAETLTDVRGAMSRRGDFDPVPAHYANDTNIFEVLAALEALTIEDEVLT